MSYVSQPPSRIWCFYSLCRPSANRSPRGLARPWKLASSIDPWTRRSAAFTARTAPVACSRVGVGEQLVAGLVATRRSQPASWQRAVRSRTGGEGLGLDLLFFRPLAALCRRLGFTTTPTRRSRSTPSRIRWPRASRRFSRPNTGPADFLFPLARSPQRASPSLGYCSPLLPLLSLLVSHYPISEEVLRA